MFNSVRHDLPIVPATQEASAGGSQSPGIQEQFGAHGENHLKKIKLNKKFKFTVQARSIAQLQSNSSTKTS